MKNLTKSKKGTFNKSCILLAVFILVIASVFSATTAPLYETIRSTENNVSYSFVFIEPTFQTIEADNSGYTSINLAGCIAVGRQAGGPSLPVKCITLLLPPMKRVTDITVGGSPVEIDMGCIDLKQNPVVPYQESVPIGSTEPQDFAIDTEVYASNALYPSFIYEDYHIGYSRGYAILDITLNPVQYIPGEGRLFFYPEITVTIEFEDSQEVNPFFRNNQNDKAWVETLVYNPEITDFYTEDIPTSEYPGGLCDPSDDYDYIIITTTQNGLDYWSTDSSRPYNWESLMEKHETDDGLQCTLVTIQNITACPDYYSTVPLFNDSEARIREFCRDAYQDWGAQYVFIGGDDEWIRARHMKYAYEGNVDSDLYWSNLDNTFNDDHDQYWGEENDLGFDLYSELFIGRITCDEPQDVSNWMTKSFYYADNNDIDYLENAAFYGGNTGWMCEGDDFVDYSAIKGTDDWLGPDPGSHGPYPTWLGFQYGFETWNAINPGNEYNLSVKWTAEPPNPGWQGGSYPAATEGLKNDINNDHVTLISGIAHANAQMSLDVNMDSWESDYHNTRPFFIHDYGCHCGDMDAADDGVLHSMLFHSDTELAFACIYNTCYGWGSQSDTNSSSALQQKLFWDYFFDVANNSGSPMNWQLGKAMAFSKDKMASTINWTSFGAPGSWRGIIQGCLLFGDPAQRLKDMTIPPETPIRPEGPSEGIIEKQYPFTTSTTEPEGEQVYYLWDWDDGTPGDWDGPYDSGVTVLTSHIWSEAGTYEVRVKAKDIQNAESSWSDPLTVHIIDVPMLHIESITGGLLKINTVIKNNGTDAIGVNWRITLDGGVILLGKEQSGKINTIPAGESVQFVSNAIFGFGKTLINATVECEGGQSDTTTKEAFVFLFFIV